MQIYCYYLYYQVVGPVANGRSTSQWLNDYP